MACRSIPIVDLKRCIKYLEKLRVLGIEFRGADMMSFVPLLIHKTAIVCKILNDMVFGNLDACRVDESLIGKFKYLFGSSATQR